MENRNITFDLAKGIGIILMVIGHTHFPEPIRKFIYSFHMPLFFIISGIFFNAKKYSFFTNLFQSRFQTLAIPFFCFSVMVATIYFILGNDVMDIIRNGWGGYALWFLPVLFFSEFIFWTILKIVNNNSILRFIITLCLLLVGYYLSLRNIHVPYKFEVIFMALFFFNVGFTFSVFFKNVKIIPYVYLLSLFIAQFILSYYLKRLDMCPNEFGTFPWSIIIAISGSVLIFYLSKRISKWNENNWVRLILNWAGNNTITILGLSPIITTVFYTVLDKTSLPRYVIYVVVYVMLWVILYFMSVFFNKKARFIVGKKYN